MHASVRALLLALPLVLWPRIATAEHDSFGLGTGRAGALSITDGGVIVNRYAVLTQARVPGDTVLPVSDGTGFSAGDLVLVYQPTGLLPVPPSGDAGPLDLSTTSVGRWELGRVAQSTAASLTLTAPLQAAYAANVSQVIFVPEYTNVTVAPGTSLLASAWDGTSGGVLAFLASGVVTNDGALTADRAGFRGGIYLDDNPPTGNVGCVGVDQPPAVGGQKGEGIAPGLFGGARYGMGNVANGGGGGNCHDSGGGGGGNVGPGGQGGFSWAGDGSRDVGGRGGAPLTYSPLDRLVLGGGGGAGYGHEYEGSSGGRGGGAVLIRANQLRGSGRVSANGDTALYGGGDGAGGGGAGGSVYLRITGSAACGSAEAIGGNGGPVGAAGTGPGGGGGGGSVLVQAASVTCPMDPSSGASGLDSSATNYGAEPTAANAGSYQGATLVLDAGYALPPMPVLQAPANGLETVDPRPTFSGSAVPRVNVVLLVDGVELARVPSTDAGTFSFQPRADLALGGHVAQAQSEFQLAYSARTATNTFTVVVDAGTPDAGTPDAGTPDAGTPDAGVDAGVPDAGADGGEADAGNGEPMHLDVGCGCGAAPDALAVSLVLGVVALAARRRSPRR